MRNQKRWLVATGILFWLGMFAATLYQDKGQMPPLLIAALFFICFVAGIFFWASMSLFLKFAAKYSGTNIAQPKQRTKMERVVSLLSLPFAVGPVFYAFYLEENLLWPILASSIPSFLLFSPLLSKPPGNDRLVARSVASLGCGILIFLFLYQYFIVGVLSFPSAHILLVSAISTLSWCISYLLCLQANRPNSAF